MPGWSTYDVGDCCCLTCECYPCPLPKANLTVSLLRTSDGATGSVVLPYTFVPATGLCQWGTPTCIPMATGQSFRFQIICIGTCTCYIAKRLVGNCTSGIDPAGGQFFYSHGPGGCCSPYGASGNPLNITASTCSPLSITLKDGPFIPNQYTFTITP